MSVSFSMRMSVLFSRFVNLCPISGKIFPAYRLYFSVNKSRMSAYSALMSSGFVMWTQHSLSPSSWKKYVIVPSAFHIRRFMTDKQASVWENRLRALPFMYEVLSWSLIIDCTDCPYSRKNRNDSRQWAWMVMRRENVRALMVRKYFIDKSSLFWKRK